MLGCPKLLRADRGTENTKIAFMQPFLRRHGTDTLSGENSFRYGRSVHNQVQECNYYNIFLAIANTMSCIRELSGGGGVYTSGAPCFG